MSMPRIYLPFSSFFSIVKGKGYQDHDAQIFLFSLGTCGGGFCRVGYGWL
jgi:hypothetical protein